CPFRLPFLRPWAPLVRPPSYSTGGGAFTFPTVPDWGWQDAGMRSPTAEWYHRTATRELVGHSALHVAWAAGVADDEDVLELLDRLPRERRQPSLIFSVATWLGAEATDYDGFRTWLIEN